jgi:hypothetical protein
MTTINDNKNTGGVLFFDLNNFDLKKNEDPTNTVNINISKT